MKIRDEINSQDKTKVAAKTKVGLQSSQIVFMTKIKIHSATKRFKGFLEREGKICIFFISDLKEP